MVRLRILAIRVLGGLRHGRSLNYGMAVEDLVAAGWLGYQEAKDGDFPAYRWTRTRWAMVDELRRWYGATNRDRPDWRSMGDQDVRQEVDQETFREWETQADGWRVSSLDQERAAAWVRQVLPPRAAALVERIAIQGEPLDDVWEGLGFPSRRTAVVARSKAISKLHQERETAQAST